MLAFWSGLLATGLALAASTVSANVCPPAEPGIQALYQDFSQLQSALRLARDELDTSQFDPLALQARLGQEPDELLGWVRDQTRWLNYEGSLRGPVGVVMDRMGSSLDRSLLLAEMLQAAGHRVQLARGPLEKDDLDRLRAAHGGQQPAIEPVSSIPSADLEAAAEKFGLTPSALKAEFEQRSLLWHEVRDSLGRQTERQADALSGTLNGETTEAVSGPREHWWVQIEGRGGWRDLDPALPELAPGDTLLGSAFETLAVGELDPDQYHRLTVRISAEQWNNGRLREHTALEQSFPASALAGQQLRIDLVPTALPELNEWLAQVPTDLPSQVSEADEWLPVLRVGDEPLTDQMILIDGSVRPADGAPAQARAMEDATGALGGISLRGRGRESAGPRTELSAVQVHLLIEAPGQADITLTRALMDMVGPAGREERRVRLAWNDELRQQRAVAMLGHLQLQAQMAWLNETFVAFQRYSALIDDRLAGLAVLDAWAHDRSELMEQALDSRSELNDALLALAQMRSLFSPEQPRIALTGLNLLAWFEEVSLEGEVPASVQGFDILHNPVNVLAGSTSEQALTRLRQGVFDTVLEAWIVDNEGDQLADNTGRHFQRSLDDGEVGLWLHGVADAAELEVSLPTDIHHHIANALAQGRVVVLVDPLASPAQLSWWEIDPVSGTALGYGPNRRGQASEGVIMFWEALNNARSAVAMVHSVWGCLFKHGSAPGMQCCIRNVALKEALNRFMSGFFGDAAKVTGLTAEYGSVFVDTLNKIAIGNLTGRLASGVANQRPNFRDPSAGCPDRLDTMRRP